MPCWKKIDKVSQTTLCLRRTAPTALSIRSSGSSAIANSSRQAFFNSNRLVLEVLDRRRPLRIAQKQEGRHQGQRLRGQRADGQWPQCPSKATCRNWTRQSRRGSWSPGGEIVGKSVSEQLCSSGGSQTSDTGPVLNPHDPTRLAGGSRCAALVVAHECDMAIRGD